MLPRLQEMVLLKVSRLGPDCTVRDVMSALSRETGEDQAFNSIHKTLHRLVEQGNVARRDGFAGSRATQTYAITPDGQVVLERSIQATCNVYEGVLTRIPRKSGLGLAAPGTPA